MGRPIHLDRQLQRRTIEIQHEAVNTVLPPEFDTRYLPTAKFAPQNAFGFRHLGAQASAFGLFGVLVKDFGHSARVPDRWGRLEG